MPWKTLCKHRTPPLPWKLWSIISSSSVIYIPAPLCCGKERGENLFVFRLIVDRLTLWPVLLVSVRKRIFSPSYLKMKFQGKVSAPSGLFSQNNVYTLRGEDEKQEQPFFKCRRRALPLLKGNSTALIDIIQWNLWWSFQNPVKAFGAAGFCGAPLWVGGSGWHCRGKSVPAPAAWEEDGSQSLCELSFF